MTTIKANCVICAKPLRYAETSSTMTCYICGKQETGRCSCEEGHYVCDQCHRTRGVDVIMDICSRSISCNPIEIAQQIMRADDIYPNGPEHHSLVGATLLCAFKNAGGAIDLDAALCELRSRSMQIPGGTCGYWGCCGAAISAGQFYSIVSQSTPLSGQAWSDCARLTSRILGKLADIGGPRCCKRSSFTALRETAAFVAETTEVNLEIPERITCTFVAGNAQCKKRDCPYFPQKN